MSIPEGKIREMASAHWGVEGLTDYHWEKTIEFAQLVEKEVHRRVTIENTRMGCTMNGGHQFLIKGNFGSITSSGSDMIFEAWAAYGECQNCDAVLAVSYRGDV